MSSVGETGAFAVEMARAMKDTTGRAEPAAIGRRYVDSAPRSAIWIMSASSTRP